MNTYIRYHIDEKKHQAPYVIDEGQDKVGDSLCYGVRRLARHFKVQRYASIQQKCG